METRPCKNSCEVFIAAQTVTTVERAHTPSGGEGQTDARACTDVACEPCSGTLSQHGEDAARTSATTRAPLEALRQVKEARAKQGPCAVRLYWPRHPERADPPDTQLGGCAAGRSINRLHHVVKVLAVTTQAAGRRALQDVSSAPGSDPTQPRTRADGRTQSLLPSSTVSTVREPESPSTVE